MEHEAEKIDGITLEMQDGENDVSKTTNKLEAALTKGADAIAVCAPDRLCTAELMKKADAENVPVVFFNMEPTAFRPGCGDTRHALRPHPCAGPYGPHRNIFPGAHQSNFDLFAGQVFRN